MLKSLFCEEILAEYEFESEKFKGSIDRRKLNNSDLSANTLEFKTLPTRPRSHRYILFCIFPMESVKICRFKTLWMRILYGEPCCYLDVSIYMLKCVFC